MFCLQCKKLLTTPQSKTHCSTLCASRWQNARKSLASQKERNKHKKICVICKTSYEKKKWSSWKEFRASTCCSKLCAVESAATRNRGRKSTKAARRASSIRQKGSNNSNWRSKPSDSAVAVRARNEYLEIFLREHSEFFCEIKDYERPCRGNTVDLHHIVYRSECRKHPEKHNQRNLILLCRGHHKWLHDQKNRRDFLIQKRRLWELFEHLKSQYGQ